MSVGASASKTPESATPSKKRALKAAAKDEETTTPKKRIKLDHKPLPTENQESAQIEETKDQVAFTDQ